MPGSVKFLGTKAVLGHVACLPQGSVRASLVMRIFIAAPLPRLQQLDPAEGTAEPFELKTPLCRAGQLFVSKLDKMVKCRRV
jgi:hypothetical protein